MRGWCHGSWCFRVMTYLGDQGPLPGVSPGPRIGRREVAWRGPRASLPSRLCSPFCSTSSGPGPRASLSRCWYARSRCRGQGQRVRAGEPVGVHESRCSGTPPLRCKRFARARVKETLRRPRPTLLLKEILRAHHNKNESFHHNRQPATGCSGGLMRAPRA